MSEIGEEAAPAAVPATGSPVKPIVVKLTSKPAAQEEQAVSADPDEDPLSTMDNPIASEDNVEKPVDEDTKAADEQTKAADEETKAADETTTATDVIKLTDSTVEADAAKVEDEVKAAEESNMETTEVSEKPALVLNPIATTADKNVESDAMETEEKLFYEEVKDLEAEAVEEQSTKPADEADTKQGEEQVEEPAENPAVEKDVEMQEEVGALGDMDELDYEDGVEDMIEINTDDISFDEPPKPTSEPKFKPKPITAPAADNGLTPGTIITGKGITGTFGSTSATVTDAKEVTGSIIQFNDENVLFEFSADGCRGLIGLVKTKHLKIPGKVFVSGSTKDMIKFIKVRCSLYQTKPLHFTLFSLNLG